jgi:dienelactone hydrolase
VTEVVLFHHVRGLTPGLVEFADTVRAGGHVVHTPDLFQGRTFNSLEDGMGFVQSVGLDQMMSRGVSAAAHMPPDVVYAGVSFGVLPAQKLAQTRPGARGAILMEACAPASQFSPYWPDGVSVQIHGMDNDPFFAGEGDVAAAQDIVDNAHGTYRAQLFLYPGSSHLFTDPSLDSYDRDASALMTARLLSFLDALVWSQGSRLKQ